MNLPVHPQCPYMHGHQVQQWLDDQGSTGYPFSQAFVESHPCAGVNPSDTTTFLTIGEGNALHQGSHSPLPTASSSHLMPMSRVDFNSSTGSLATHSPDPSLSPFTAELNSSPSPATTYSWHDAILSQSAITHASGLDAASAWGSQLSLHDFSNNNDRAHPYSAAYHDHFVHDASEGDSSLFSGSLMDTVMFDEYDVLDASSAHCQEQPTSSTSPGPSSSSSSHPFRTRIGSRYMTEAGYRRRAKGQRRVYVCTIPDCGAELTSKANWRSHEKAHWGIKEWQCELCAKSFGWRHVLRRHVRTCKGPSKTKLET